MQTFSEKMVPVVRKKFNDFTENYSEGDSISFAVTFKSNDDFIEKVDKVFRQFREKHKKIKFEYVTINNGKFSKMNIVCY